MKGTSYAGMMGPGIGAGLSGMGNSMANGEQLGLQIKMAQLAAQNKFNNQQTLQKNQQDFLQKQNQAKLGSTVVQKELDRQNKLKSQKNQQDFLQKQNQKKLGATAAQKELDRQNKLQAATIGANAKKANFDKGFNQKLTSNAETLYNNTITKNPYVKDYSQVQPIISRFNDAYDAMIKDPTNTKLQTAFLDTYVRVLNGNKALRQFMVQNAQDIQTSPEKVKGWFQKNIQSGGLGFSLDTLNRIHQYVDTAQGHIAKKAQEQIQNAQQVAEKAGFGQQFGLLTKGLTGSSVNANTPPTTSIPFSPGQMYNGHKILSVQAVP